MNKNDWNIYVKTMFLALFLKVNPPKEQEININEKKKRKKDAKNTKCVEKLLVQKLSMPVDWRKTLVLVHQSTTETVTKHSNDELNESKWWFLRWWLLL